MKDLEIFADGVGFYVAGKDVVGAQERRVIAGEERAEVRRPHRPEEEVPGTGTSRDLSSSNPQTCQKDTVSPLNKISLSVI